MRDVPPPNTAAAVASAARQARRAAWPWAGPWLGAALLSACSAGPAEQVARPAAHAAAAPAQRPSQPQQPSQVQQMQQVQYRCADGQQLQVRYEHQGGRPAGRAIVEFAGQRIAMQPVAQTLQPHYVAQAQGAQQASYRWRAGQGDGAGGLSIKAAGSAAVDVPLLQGCQRAAGAPGAPQE
ncbi:hypothetical protein EBQ34_02785 [Vandammella animalimorsus]|uniref:C-type lysozyme inhibitor domain-containing protein n=1 Tax=Vandammella animalimorsus TaxID=2029117 RepID=A0A3M6RRM7_9BURK|nr:hypothetical protein [Vandammella animalimorsus]RMX18013.1 hypothetical protein EBQ34_02785 [Vandammella animalimorsus]